jgi:hypothetical protein
MIFIAIAMENLCIIFATLIAIVLLLNKRLSGLGFASLMLCFLILVMGELYVLGR